jgi:glycosyltransferase involved in cell wall biosynthesis
MKVCLIIEKDYPQTGTAREVHTLLGLGYNITLICRADKKSKKPSREKTKNLEIIRIKAKPSEKNSIFDNLKEIKNVRDQVIKHAIKSNPDVIHCHGHMICHGVKLKKILKKPLIFDMRENYPDMIWYSRENKPLYLPFLVLFHKYTERWACRKADEILAIVEESKDRLVKLGFDRKKITAIMNAEIPENYSKDKIDGDLKKKLDKNYPKEIIISYIGNFGHHRGLDIAIDAMKIVKKDVPNVTLLIVGGGEGFNDLKNKISPKDNVVLAGKQPHDSLPTYLSVSDIGLIPHRSNPHVETTVPNKIFQNMLMGKPQIVSDVKPLKRIVNETNSGLTFKAGDPISLAESIITLAKDKKLRKSLGENGRKAAIEKYNWNVEGEKLARLYKKFEKNSGVKYK